MKIAPLVFGGNVFGWTADEGMTYRLLDAFVDAGFNLIDTADAYSIWAPGNRGGESETLIGKWLRKSGKRDRVLIATKVGIELSPTQRGLGRRRIVEAVEDSLRRLQIDTIDLYQTHKDDLATPVAETLAAYDGLVRAGKVRAIGASQMTPARLEESLACSQREGWARYATLQPLYNLYDRAGYERDLQSLCERHRLGVIPYYGLAAGFLTGKYRVREDLKKSARGAHRVDASYFNERGFAILAAMDRVAARLDAPLASVAIAWLLSRPSVTAPIASATSPEQLADLVRGTTLKLDPESLRALEAATRPE